MFEAVKVLLENETISQEVATKLDSEISSKLGELRDEAKANRLEKEELAKSFNEVKKVKDDLEAKVGNIDEKIRLAKEEGKSDIVKVLEQERAEHKTLSDNLASFEKENTKLRINSAVSSELNKYKVKGDLVGDATTVLSGMTRVEDGNVLFGEDGTTLEDGVKSYFESRQSYLEPQGNGGSGAKGGGGGSQPKGNMGGTTTERLSAIQSMIDDGK